MINNQSVGRVKKLLIAAVLSTVTIFTSANDVSSILALVGEQRYSEALAEIDALIAAQPSSAELLFLKAITLNRMGDEAAAMMIYENLTQSHPAYPEPYNNLAIYYANRGDYETAISILESAIKSNKSYQVAYDNLTSIYEKLASEAYRKALNSETPPVSLNLVALDTLSRSGKIPGDSIVDASIDATQAESGQPQLNDEPILNPAPAVETGAVEVTPPESSQATAVIPEPTPVPEQPDRNKIVARRVLNWASSWARQDLDLYLSHYSPDFLPAQGLTMDDLKIQMEDRILNSEFIVFRLSNLDIYIDGDNASAHFRQDYKSNLYAWSGTKTLKLSQIAGEWYIIQELNK